MNEVKKCSISGIAFTLDADAYNALTAYLEELKKSCGTSPDGNEIVTDIEARIAELILSTQDNTRVVELALIRNIIAQLGSAEAIGEESSEGIHTPEEPRIPRRLYRDKKNARLGGVCAGIAQYFDLDPTWIRLALFMPLICLSLSGLSFMRFLSPFFANLFGVFIICYLIMWFAVPVARSARQKLEMQGEKITVQSIRDMTADNRNDADRHAKPIVANAVSAFGQVVLILLKLITGLIVFALIAGASLLIILFFSLVVGGTETVTTGLLNEFSIWIPILGIFVALIPCMMLIYVLMCLIASRKPGSRTILTLFLLWLATVIACSVLAIRDDIWTKLIDHERYDMDRILRTEITTESTTVSGEEAADGTPKKTILHISKPDKQIDISVDGRSASITVKETAPQEADPTALVK